MKIEENMSYKDYYKWRAEEFLKNRELDNIKMLLTLPFEK